MHSKGRKLFAYSIPDLGAQFSTENELPDVNTLVSYGKSALHGFDNEEEWHRDEQKFSAFSLCDQREWRNCDLIFGLIPVLGSGSCGGA